MQRILDVRGSQGLGDFVGPVAPSRKRSEQQVKVEYSQSDGLRNRLSQLGCSIAFSSYQSGLLYQIGLEPGGGLHLHQAALAKPMGLHYGQGGELTVACGAQILTFQNVLAPHERINGFFDACFVPRQVHTTGSLDAHDVGMGCDGVPVFVNTRFNCIATVSSKHSFEPIWKPPFITELVDEDRCHLNGMAMRGGAPAYVTVVSQSNTIDGWRDRRDCGGVVVEVGSGRIVCRGLSMPHSPRWHDGQLWLLNSGTGELGFVEGLDGDEPGTFKPVIFCPGFLRGLSFYKGYAFVGLSKPRYKRFEGLPLEGKLQKADSEPWCGVQIIDLASVSCVDWFRIDGAIAELYDVEVIPGFVTPMAVSPNSPEAANLITWSARSSATVPRGAPHGRQTKQNQATK